jgi:hypothetical protein
MSRMACSPTLSYFGTRGDDSKNQSHPSSKIYCNVTVMGGEVALP